MESGARKRLIVCRHYRIDGFFGCHIAQIAEGVVILVAASGIFVAFFELLFYGLDHPKAHDVFQEAVAVVVAASHLSSWLPLRLGWVLAFSARTPSETMSRMIYTAYFPFLRVHS